MGFEPTISGTRCTRIAYLILDQKRHARTTGIFFCVVCLSVVVVSSIALERECVGQWYGSAMSMSLPDRALMLSRGSRSPTYFSLKFLTKIWLLGGGGGRGEAHDIDRFVLYLCY